MIEDPHKKKDSEDDDEKSASGKGFVQLVKNLSREEDSEERPEESKKIEDAVDASAAQEARIRRAGKAQSEREGDDETISAHDTDDTADSSHQAGASAKAGRQDVFPATVPRNERRITFPQSNQGPQLASVAVSPAGSDAADAVGLADLFVILRRNLRFLVIIVVLGTSVAALALTQVTPRYTAATKILLGTPVTINRGAEIGLSNFTDDEASLQSQVAVLTSADMALRVIDELDLAKYPDFAPDPATPQQSGAGAVSPARMETLKKYQNRLRVEHLRKTRIVTVSFSATDPTLSSRAANKIADLYIQGQREQKLGAITESARWLSSNVSELQGKVSESELAIENFKLQNGLIAGGGVTLSDQELSSLSMQLLESRALAMETQARLSQIRNLLTTPGGVDSAAEVLDSTLIQNLREQESLLLAEIAELGAELGDKHPRMVQLQAEADQVRQKIDEEITKIVNALEYRYNIQRSREQAIEASLASATGQLQLDADAMVQLNAMERETAADRLLLETMLGQLKQLSSQGDISTQEPDARIISRALTPVEPSFPMTRGILALSVAGSGILALIFVLTREFTDRTVRCTAQLVNEIKLEPIGIMPRINRRQRQGRSLFQYAVQRPRSRFAEAARAIAQRAAEIERGTSGSVVMITAAQHGDGKADTALVLANALAAQGRLVMLVDGDHYRPQLHIHVKAPTAPGLIEIVNRRNSIDDSVFTANGSASFAFMPTGERGSLLRGGPDYAEFQSTLDILRQHFDYIIINAPPILTGNDALVLGRMADAVVVTLAWGRTHRRTARICAEKLHGAGCRNVGGVLTDVDLRKFELYEYGQRGACTSAVDGCYAN